MAEEDHETADIGLKKSESNDREDREAEKNQDKNEGGGEISSEGCVLHVSNLTRNVRNEHLEEIFGHFGSLKKVDLRIDPKVKLSKGFAYVEYNTPSDAENAQIHMDGGQLDGNVLKVSFVLVNHRRRRSDSEEKVVPAKRADKDEKGPPEDTRGRIDAPRDRNTGNIERRDSRGGRSRSPARPGRGSSIRGRGGGRGAPGRGRRSPPPRREPRRSPSPVRRRRSSSRSRSPYRRRRSPSPVRRRPRSPDDRGSRARGRRSPSRSSSYSSRSSYSSSSRSGSSSRSSSRSSRTSSSSSRSHSDRRRGGERR